MMRPICVTCKIEMECMKNDVAVWHPIEGKYVHEMMRDATEGEKIDFVIFGDRYECPNCKVNIVTGFSTMQTAEYKSNTAKLLDQIAELKEKLHKHDKAIARIEHWQKGAADPIRQQTLERVLSIFEEEVGE